MPAGKSLAKIDIEYTASKMYLFPVGGAIIGIMVGGLACLISFYIPSLLMGFIVVGVLILLTGLSHTEALADFADGILAKGDKEAKHRAMSDPASGPAGVIALVLYISGMIIVLSGFTSGVK